MRQYNLFEEVEIKSNNIEDKIVYRPINNSKATFKSGTNKSIHQWFRLTPSFGPDLVDIMLADMNYKDGDVVLDPFSGASTTIIQCKLNKIKSFGFEINPLLYFVSKTCIEWELKYDELQKLYEQINTRFHSEKTRLSNKTLNEIELQIPTIHNVQRWWRDDVLKDLLILKNTIKTLQTEQKYIDFFLLGLSAVLVPDLSNVTLGKLQLHFIDRKKDEINVFETFDKHIKDVIDDINIINKVGNFPHCDLYHTDSTDLKLNIKEKANLVITSPPYPNRYSYVWNTRPHLFFLDIFNNPKQASELDLKTIGGTWGTATSVLTKGSIEPIYPELNEILNPTIEAIRVSDNLMANYVMKYFNLLAKQIVEMEKVTQNNTKVAYVVGNSEIKGVYVATDILLAKIFEALNLGYTTTKILRFRKRNSGVDLYESIVYAEK